MSQLNRKALKKLILKEFRMMGMAPMGAVGDAPLGMSRHGTDHGIGEDYLASAEDQGHHAGGTVSKEDCCKAVLCLIECCSCPITKQKLQQCCDEILASC